jgi:phosphoglycolate phosphatase
MAPVAYAVVFFDLDGTLTDPTVGITRSVQYALSRFGIEAAPSALRPFIGPPLKHSFMRYYGFDEATAKAAVDYYREYFGERGIHENELIPGIPELLRELRAAGRRLLVVTSKPAFYAEQIVGHFGIAQFFDYVVGAAMDLTDQDKALLIGRAMGLCSNQAPADFVMVGDREHDIRGASANGIDAVGVTYGAGSREELSAAGASQLADSVGQLAALLR